MSSEDHAVFPIYSKQTITSVQKYYSVIPNTSWKYEMDSIMVAEYLNRRIIYSIHPHMKNRTAPMTGIAIVSSLEFHEAFGSFDFVQLEKHALRAQPTTELERRNAVFFTFLLSRSETARKERNRSIEAVLLSVRGTALADAVKVSCCICPALLGNTLKGFG